MITSVFCINVFSPCFLLPNLHSIHGLNPLEPHSSQSWTCVLTIFNIFLFAEVCHGESCSVLSVPDRDSKFPCVWQLAALCLDVLLQYTDLQRCWTSGIPPFQYQLLRIPSGNITPSEPDSEIRCSIFNRLLISNHILSMCFKTRKVLLPWF